MRVASGHEEPSLGQQSHDVAGCVVRRQMLAEPVQCSGDNILSGATGPELSSGGSLVTHGAVYHLSTSTFEKSQEKKTSLKPAHVTKVGIHFIQKAQKYQTF